MRFDGKVAVLYVTHVETLIDAGLVAFVVDLFGVCGITFIVANQVQYFFAASVWDVLAVWTVLLGLSEIDPSRIGAQGYSWGGSAVLTAATRRFADVVLGFERGLVAVLAVYLWSGHQFLDPCVGATRICVLMGDCDEWCLLQQVQGYMQVIRLTGGAVTLRVFGGAAHSFDWGMLVARILDVAVASGVSIIYLADNGVCIHFFIGEVDPVLTDRDLVVYAFKAGYGVRGASLGSQDTEVVAFCEDMLVFWISTFAVLGELTT